jgi:hypothetical protein
MILSELTPRRMRELTWLITLAVFLLVALVVAGTWFYHRLRKR